MSRDKDKLIRQLSLLSFLLSQPRPFTAREVQESVEGYAEMSDSTFDRRFSGDRVDLAKIGIEIQRVSDVERADVQLYFLSEDNFYLPRVDFTPTELHALALGLAALDGRFAYARPLRLALTAISQGLPDPMRDELTQLPIAFAPDEDAQRAGKQLARLQEAITRGKTVWFHYFSAGNDLHERTLDPYSLFLIQSRWYVVGFDHTRAAIRTFRVDRIQGVVHFRTEKTCDFSIPSDYDAESYRARPPWLIGPARGTATIRVSDDLAWWVTRLKPHVQQIGDDTDGCTRFAVPYADKEVLLSWVVGLGKCGELLEPATLRQELRDSMRAIARSHRESLGEKVPVCVVDATRPPRPRARPALDATGPIAPERLARALALLSYLVDERRPSLVTWQALKEDLGLVRAEIEDDLSLVNLANFGGGTYALTAETVEEGVKVVRDTMADTFARPARLSPLMARALLLALDLLGETILLDGMESLASVRKKVHALVGSDSREKQIVVDDVQPFDQAIIEVLNHAIHAHHVVDLEYFTSSREELGSRPVEPYLLFRSRDGWYLEAYCLKVGAQRTFKLERIRAARSSGASFIPRTDIDLGPRAYGQAFSPDKGASWATVRFEERWLSHLDDKGIDYELGSPGFVTAQVPYLDERWMAREILRFLGGAVLQQPAPTRKAVWELASALAIRYDGEST